MPSLIDTTTVWTSPRTELIYEYWMSRCGGCSDFEYDDTTLGKCIHFKHCKAQEQNK